VAATAAAAGGDGIAAAAPATVERSTFPLIADGSRYAASKPNAETLLVRDDAGGRRAFAVRANCHAEDAHRGVFLVNCADVPFVVKPESRRLERVPDEGAAPDRQDHLGDVGTHWMRGTTARNGVFYVNWHTGERKAFGEVVDDAVARDLDSPRLRRIDPSLLFESKRVRIRFYNGALRATRRGKRPRALCSRCYSTSVGGGLVTWATDAVAYGYEIKTGRRLRWNFDRPIADADRLFFGVQHTRRYVYFNVPEASDPFTEFLVRRVRW
jgi:hypothetical protein